MFHEDALFLIKSCIHNFLKMKTQNYANELPYKFG